MENIASAAANVGSSFLAAAGVPVLDRDRLVDFPNDPVSGTALRALETAGLSLLEESEDGLDMFCADVLLTQEIALRMVSELHRRRCTTPRLEHCVGLREAFRSSSEVREISWWSVEMECDRVRETLRSVAC